MDAIIYGAGILGAKTLAKYKHKYNIPFFCDSDKSKWGSKTEGFEIKSPEYAVEYANQNECIIIIASMYYPEIAEKLISLNLDAEKTRLLYSSSYNSFLEEIGALRRAPRLAESGGETKASGKKPDKGIKVLFVQKFQNSRTFKLATALKKEGIETDHAFLDRFEPQTPDGEAVSTYGKLIAIDDLGEFMEYINKSDYDIIHCSNEPDHLCAFLVNCEKKVVHDTHDMMTLRGGANVTNYTVLNEYTANKYSDGNLYVTDFVKNYAAHKYGLKNKPLFSINNYAIKEQTPNFYKEKLSAKDNEIHCVYEGGLASTDWTVFHHRYIEPLLLSIANAGIHVHFYGAFGYFGDYYKELEAKSPYIHNEGYIGYSGLVNELTQYDIGLALLNVNEGNRDFLSTTFPNKFFDYLLAGLPIAAISIPPYNEFIEKYKCGVTLDFNKDIMVQIKRTLSIEIPKTFVKDNKLFMEDRISGLIDFYEQVMAQPAKKAEDI